MTGPTAAKLGYEVDLAQGYASAIATTKDALRAEGFGVLTEIDMQTTFRDKLGREFRPYTILGACNPPLAFAALSADPEVGLLLPCNVTVEAIDADHARVRLVDPRAMLSATPGPLSPGVKEVADNAHARIERVVAVLRTQAHKEI